MSDRMTIGSLCIAKPLADFIGNEALPGTGLPPERFWGGLAALVRDFAPRNRELLATRDRLQAKIDDFLRTSAGKPASPHDYKQFLYDIGYLVPEVERFSIRTHNVDPEIAEIAGPQLVVPLSNARYALNAANARWGSLYDALYGTDAIPETDGSARGATYNPVRGAKVIAYARQVLDLVAPLGHGAHHRNAVAYTIAADALAVRLADGRT